MMNVNVRKTGKNGDNRDLQASFRRAYPLLFQVGNSAVAKKVIDVARWLIPKAFFQVVKQRLRMANRTPIVKGFRREIINGELQERQSVAEYVGEVNMDTGHVDVEIYTAVHISDLMTSQEL